MPSLPNAQKYLECREAARRRAQHELLAHHPEAAPLVALGNEYVASCMLALSGRDFTKIKHGPYISDLVVSFTRTHFVAQELLGYGELIEAAVLIRKQMELLARLHELVKTDKLHLLVRTTPNVREISLQVRKLYSAYSELAHSSDPIHLQQLGEIERDGKLYTPVYPTYTKHAIVTLRHQALTVVEFHHWSRPYLNDLLSEFDAEAAEALIGELAREYVNAYAQNHPHV
jgi:hypothetical protein